MKQLLLLAIATLFFSANSFAKIWRVNNNAGVNANFTTIQSAHDGAADGDTLYMEGSATSYGQLQCSKKLTIIGPGYFLSENPNNQVVTATAKIDNLYFYAGAENSVVSGMQIAGIQVYCSNIVIRRNLMATANGSTYDYSTGNIVIYNNSSTGVPVSNISIIQNYGTYINVSYAASTGILVMNNYLGYPAFGGDATTGNCITLAEGAQVIVQNNILRRGTITSSSNASFSNNILVNGTFNGVGLYSNNLASGTQFGTANGNLANVNMANVFAATNPWDTYWKLKAGSPAIGAGYGGVDAGMYGGNLAYVLSGMPAIPSIYSFINQPIGSNTDPINVTIKVKSNN